MKNPVAFFSLSVVSLLTLLGFSQVREIKSLKKIVATAGSKPFSLTTVKNGIVSGVLQLLFTNPSTYKVEIESLVIDIFYRGELLATVPAISFVINGSKNTTVNVPLQLEFKKLLRLGEDVILNPSAMLQLKGRLNYISQTLKLTIPYEFEFTIDVKQEVNKFLLSSN